MTSLALVAPFFSSTSIATSISDLTLLVSPLPLAQCTMLEMDETSCGDVDVLEDASLVRLKEHELVEPCLKEPPFEELCSDVVMGSDTPSIKHTDPIFSELVNLTLTSSPLLPTTPSHLHDYHESLGDIRGYYPNLDPYCV